jgi:hypothetical protein
LVKLIGKGAKHRKSLKLSAESLDFGKQPVLLSSVPRDGKLTNTGNVPITVESIEVTGPDTAAFKWATDEEPTVEAGQERRITVTFCPNESRKFKAGFRINSDADHSPHKVSLKGNAVWTELSPESLSFGDQKVGTRSAAQTVTLTNPSDAELFVTSIRVAGGASKEFKWETTGGSRPTVKADDKHLFSVIFEPEAALPRTATLNVTYRAGGNLERTEMVQLSGTGLE